MRAEDKRDDGAPGDRSSLELPVHKSRDGGWLLATLVILRHVLQPRVWIHSNNGQQLR